MTMKGGDHVLFVYECEYCDCTKETDTRSTKYRCFACDKKMVEKESFGSRTFLNLSDNGEDLVVIPEIQTRKLLKRRGA